MPPDRCRQPETSRGSEAANVSPFRGFPIQKFEGDTNNREKYLENKLEAQLEVQCRETYASQSGEHCPSDDGIRSQNPNDTNDSPQHAGKKRGASNFRGR